IGGAVDRRPRAGLGEVARPGGGTALDEGAGNAVRGAVVVDAVAALGDVADAGGGAADVRALQVGRAVDGRPVAGLGEVARAGSGPALDGRPGKGVRRAVVVE